MITASYTGREAAYVKNELLRTYLEPLFMIIGQQAPRISYIDCFSGPWHKSRPGLRRYLGCHLFGHYGEVP